MFACTSILYVLRDFFFFLNFIELWLFITCLTLITVGFAVRFLLLPIIAFYFQITFGLCLWFASIFSEYAYDMEWGCLCEETVKSWEEKCELNLI